jgi:hypothetical protein
VEINPDSSPNQPQLLDVRLRADYCHDRFCVPCARARAACISAALLDRIGTQTVRFVTFTLRCNFLSLRERLDRLYTSFNLLRRRSFWKANVTGGAAFCEVKLGSTPGNWHVHLHCLVVGRWMEQKQLVHEWHAVTGDSVIVWIEAATGRDHVIRYVSKYVSQGATKEVYDNPDTLDEMLLALKGRRLCTTFGSWRGTVLKPTAPSSSGWQLYGYLDTLLNPNFPRKPLDAKIINVLQHRYPNRYIPDAIPPPPHTDNASPV